MAASDRRLLDREGNFVCLVSLERAQLFVDSKRAEFVGTGRRAAVRLLTYDRARDLKDDFVAKTDQLTTYKESLAGKTVVSMKRSTGGGEFKRWDNRLTFDQLRQGLLRPPRAERKEAMLQRLEGRDAD